MQCRGLRNVRLIDRLLPPACLLCGDPGFDGIALCPPCHAALPRNQHACTRCAEALPETGPGQPDLSVCGRCLWRPPPYTAIRVPFRYAAPVDWLIRRLKFHSDLAAGRLLGQLLALELQGRTGTLAAIVPLPLHPRRLLERGFNQAQELALPLARASDTPLRPRAIARCGSTVPQMELPADRRRANVRNAFRAARPLPPGRILLVDDVVTTASSMREAARAAGGDGDTEVIACAVARA